MSERSISSIEALASRHNPRLYTLLACLALGVDLTASGQTCSLGNAPHICIVGEGYTSRSDADLQRLRWVPTSSMRVSVNKPFQVRGISGGLRVLHYETSDLGIQRPNRYTLSLGHRAVTFKAGHVSPVLSRYSINGTTMLGGLLDLSPGPFRFTALAGQARRKRLDPVTERERRFPPGANERWLYSLRAGFFPQRWHLQLIGVFAEDRPVESADTALRPPSAENATLTFEVGMDEVPYKDLVLTAGLQGTGSFLTIDNRAPAIPKVAVSSLLNKGDDDKWYEAAAKDVGRWLLGIGYDSLRTSSRANFALSADVRVKWRQHALRVFGEQVEPGFVSRGVASLRADLRTIRFEPSTSFFQKRLRVQGGFTFTENNLLKNQLAERRTYRLHVQPRIVSPGFLLIGYFMRHLTRSDPESVGGSAALEEVLANLELDKGRSQVVDSAIVAYDNLIKDLEDRRRREASGLRQRLVMQSAMLSPTWRWGHPRTLSHSLTLTADWQGYSAAVVDTFRFSHTSFRVNYTVERPNGLVVTGGANILRDAIHTPSLRRYGFDLGIEFKPHTNVGVEIDVGHSGSRPCGPGEDRKDVVARQWKLNFRGSWVPPGKSGSFKLAVRALDNNSDTCSPTESSRSFTELRSGLSYVYRF